MPVSNDLTWEAVNLQAFATLGFNLAFVSFTKDAEGIEGTVTFKVSNYEKAKEYINPAGGMGVVKTTAKFMECCLEAQATLNQDKPAGERLAAFPNPAIGGATNGSVPVTRSLVARHNLFSSDKIVGATA